MFAISEILEILEIWVIMPMFVGVRWARVWMLLGFWARVCGVVWHACVCVCMVIPGVYCYVCVCCCMFLVQFYQAWHDARGGSDLVLADARVQLIHGTR